MYEIELGGRALVSWLFRAEVANGDIIVKDRKDSVIHLLESLPGVATLGSW